MFPGFRRAGAALLFLLFWISCLPGCTGRGEAPLPASDVLAAMRAAVRDLPDGVLYHRAALPDDPQYLTDTLLSALYGEAARGIAVAPGAGTPGIDTTAPVNDIALFLSVAPQPVELAVFRCSDVRGTATAAKLCRARLEIIRHAWAGSEWAGMAEGAVVTVEGSYVLLVVAEDPDQVVAAARAVLRRA